MLRPVGLGVVLVLFLSGLGVVLILVGTLSCCVTCFVVSCCAVFVYAFEYIYYDSSSSTEGPANGTGRRRRGRLPGFFFV